MKIFSLLPAVAIIISLFLGACSPSEKVFNSLSTPAKATVPQKELTKIDKVTLSAVGDILIHSTVYKSAELATGYDFNPIFTDIKPYMQSADITVANSESIVGGAEIGVSTYPSFNSPYEIGAALKNAGVDVVSLANNHTLDRGIVAIQNAINNWNNLNIIHSGAYLSEQEKNRISILTANNIRFSFLSYTYGTNGIPTPQGKEFLVNRINKEEIRQELVRAKAESDVVVLSLHFGDEYQTLPNSFQIELAHFAAENGADIILGHHPHVLQPPEWIETSNGHKSFVVYSLGNFLSGQNKLPRQIGAILHIDVEKTTTADKTVIDLKNPGFTTTFVENENYKKFKIVTLESYDSKLNEKTKKHLSTWIENLNFVE